MATEQLKKIPFDLAKFKETSEDRLFEFVDIDTVTSERITAPRYSYWRSVLRIFFKKKINWVVLVLLALLFILTFIGPFFWPYSKFENVTDASLQNLSPTQCFDRFGFSLKWCLGTGQYGNSIFYGLWSSARTSLLLAIICAAINMVLGILMGAVWGYSKSFDAVMTVIYNIIANVPYVLLISVLVYVIGAGFGPFVLALTVTGWLGIAYFFRTQVLIIRDREYNLASRCLGTPIVRVVSKNILPYMISVIVTLLATEVPSYISMEVFLSYIGIGLKSDVPALGQMINDGQIGWTTYPWAFWAPVSIAAALTIMLYLLGQNLADASDPRSHMQ